MHISRFFHKNFSVMYDFSEISLNIRCMQNNADKHSSLNSPFCSPCILPQQTLLANQSTVAIQSCPVFTTTKCHLWNLLSFFSLTFCWGFSLDCLSFKMQKKKKKKKKYLLKRFGINKKLFLSTGWMYYAQQKVDRDIKSRCNIIWHSSARTRN